MRKFSVALRISNMVNIYFISILSPMKTPFFVLAVLCAWQQSGAQPAERPPEPLELTAMRESWQREKSEAITALDRKYVADLTAAMKLHAEAGDTEAARAIEVEIAKFIPPTLTGNLAQPLEAKPSPAGQAARPAKGKITNQTRKKIQAVLEGKIWRVDHEGEGLRWYYFANDGQFARKSRLTEWVWSDLNGTWKIDDFGTVVATGVGNTAQVRLDPDGSPCITLNRAGILTMRPLVITDLAYPGPGKE